MLTSALNAKCKSQWDTADFLNMRLSSRATKPSNWQIVKHLCRLLKWFTSYGASLNYEQCVLHVKNAFMGLQSMTIVR